MLVLYKYNKYNNCKRIKIKTKFNIQLTVLQWRFIFSQYRQFKYTYLKIYNPGSRFEHIINNFLKLFSYFLYIYKRVPIINT